MTERVFAKKEAELYPPIARLLEKQGFRVWEQATVRAGDVGTRTVDHVAWKWSGSEIDALAVEVKPGRADAALAQAAAYAIGFDRVYVAAEEALSGLGYLQRVLDRLGLGYIDVEPTSARLELEASSGEFVVDTARDENLSRIRLKHLFTEEVLGEPVRFGADRRGENWGVTGTTREWQLNGHVIPDGDATCFSLLAESKRVGDLAATKLNAAELAAWVSSLGDATIVLKERRHNGFQGTYSGELRRWTPSEPEADLQDLLGFARSLSGQQVGPHFRIGVDLWPHGVALTEDRARQDLTAAIDRFRPIQKLLKERL